MDKTTLHIELNSFLLCTLHQLEWHVYIVKNNSISPESSEQSLLAHASRLEKQNRLCFVDETQEIPELWLFLVNGMQQLSTSTQILEDLKELTSDKWIPDENQINDLPELIQKQFFNTLQARMRKIFIEQHEFRQEKDWYIVNDVKFIFRCPSNIYFNRSDVFLNEDVPMPCFKPTFVWHSTSRALCVNIYMALYDTLQEDISRNVFGMKASYEQLLGLPSSSTSAIFDVWHMEDGFIPRVIAETKYSDVYPRFKTFLKRQRHDVGVSSIVQDDGEMDFVSNGSGKTNINSITPSGISTATNPEDDNDIDNSDRLDAVDSTNRANAEQQTGESDDSIIPTSPDIHINSPDSKGPLVCLTFPRMEKYQGYNTSEQVQFFKRKRRKSRQIEAVKSTTNLLNGQNPFSMPTIPQDTETLHRPNSQFDAVISEVSVFNVSAIPYSTAPMSKLQSAKPSHTPPELNTGINATKQSQNSMTSILQILDENVADDLKKALEKTSQGDRMLQNTTTCHHQLISKSYLSSTSTLSTLLSVNPATIEYEKMRFFQSKKFKLSPHSFYSPKLKLYTKQLGLMKSLKDIGSQTTQRFMLKDTRKRIHQLSTKNGIVQIVQKNTNMSYEIRDDEIHIGIQAAAQLALVTWQQNGAGFSYWSNRNRSELISSNQSLNKKGKHILGERVLPYLQSMQSMLHTKSTTKDKISRLLRKNSSANIDAWLSFNDYGILAEMLDENMEVNKVEIPDMHTSSSDSTFDVSPSAIPEYLLRNLHPVGPPKPVDYTVICPNSPRQWLGLLVKSYITSYRITYARCHMGDMVAMDISHIKSSELVTIDPDHSFAFVSAGTERNDIFSSYRAAGELMAKQLSVQGKQVAAFSRTVVANVVFLIAPFRRSDIKHKMWLLGAFCKGLIAHSPDESSAKSDQNMESLEHWLVRRGLTIEIVYLEDLYDVCVNPVPYVLLSRCFGLYNRIFERITLVPINVIKSEGKQIKAQQPQSRYICERLFHLATPKSYDKQHDNNDTCASIIYAAYTISKDAKWLLFSCVDAVGSVFDTQILEISSYKDNSMERLIEAFKTMKDLLLNFVALFGDSACLVITHMGAISIEEKDAWNTLMQDKGSFIPSQYSTLVENIIFLSVTRPTTNLQIRSECTNGFIYNNENIGYTVVYPYDHEELRLQCRIRTYNESSWQWATGTGGNANIYRENVVLRYERLNDLNVEQVLKKNVEKSIQMKDLLANMYALSFLTMHPINLDLQSPFPVHIAIIDRLDQELIALNNQLIDH